MDTFTVRDLREHTGDLIHDAEAGKLSLITKHGRPIFLAVPFDDKMLVLGLRFHLAVKLYRDDVCSIEKAAKLAGESFESFIQKLGDLGVPVVQYDIDDVKKELKDFG